MPLEPVTSPTSTDAATRRPLAVWLAGTIRWDDYLAMSERLAGDVADARGRNPTLVICEIEPCITIGRAGSRCNVRLSDDELASRRLPVRFTGRGGGAVLHGPGQVVAAMFAPLEDLGFKRHDVGGVVAAFQRGLAAAIAAVGCGSHAIVPGTHGVFGRTGLLAAVGLAFRRGVACHGGFLNATPPLDVYHRIDTIPARWHSTGGAAMMGSIEADMQRRVRIQDVRTAVVQGIADAFDMPRIHINAGLPVRIQPPHQPEVISRVG